MANDIRENPPGSTHKDEEIADSSAVSDRGTEHMDKSLFGTLLLLIALAMILYVASNLGISLQNIQKPQIRQLEYVWKQDLDNLAKHAQLPVAWNEIRIVEKIPANNDKLAKMWADNIAVPVEINPSGAYKLELLFISQVDGNTERAVIQHHITELSSGNSVWELARTYTLKGAPPEE